jgi:hypothetical protein
MSLKIKQLLKIYNIIVVLLQLSWMVGLSVGWLSNKSGENIQTKTTTGAHNAPVVLQISSCQQLSLHNNVGLQIFTHSVNILNIKSNFI